MDEAGVSKAGDFSSESRSAHRKLAALTLSTVPDVEAGQRLFGLQGLSDKAAIKAMEHLRKQRNAGDSTQPLALQRVVAFALAWGDADAEVLSAAGGEEAQLLADLFAQIERLSEQGIETVGWRLNDADLPLLRLRAMRHELSLPGCWCRPQGARDSGGIDLASALSVASGEDWRLIAGVMGLQAASAALDSDAVHAAWLQGEFARLRDSERDKAWAVLALHERYAACLVRP